MKFAALIVAVCMIGAAIAQPAQPQPGREVAESLEKRAAALLASSRAAVQELMREGRGNLVSAIEHQLVEVEALALALKTQLADTTHQHSVHHLHVIEEDLLYLENRISEELAIARNVSPNQPEHPGTDSAAAKLVAAANSIVAQAQEAVKAHPNTRETNAINAEIVEIQKLTKAIATANPNGAQFQLEAQQLARHEQTLQQLVERLSGRPHSQPMQPVNPPTNP